VALSGGHDLFLDTVSMPCYAEGGDHFFVRTIGRPGACRTVVTLKDQSGHQVGCVLRSTITDLMHHAVLTNYSAEGLAPATQRLNDEICRSELFQKDDFVTAVVAEIHHDTLQMDYLSAGHPPFLLIRGSDVMILPEQNSPANNVPFAILPDMHYRHATVALKAGDRLIFYTDGLLEAPISNREEVYTVAQLKQFVQDIIREHPGCTVSAIMKKLLERVAAESGETLQPGAVNTTNDDITLVCLEVETFEDPACTTWYPENSRHLSQLTEDLYSKLQHEWEQHGFEGAAIRLRSALEEAVQNAWQHGNQRKPGAPIEIQWRFMNDFRLEVCDSGKGFDPATAPDPTEPDHVSKPGDRGLFIIQYYCDSVQWRKNGRCIAMSFKPHADTAHDRESRWTERLMKLWKSGP
jgi:anti-sigma regulatory factor (Ser/Thr protein kinase)